MRDDSTNELELEIRRRIALNGPLNLARYMSLCLVHEEHGYYMKKDPLGVLGDFTTAPEISQMFGELIGLWCAGIWQSMGAPANMHLVELGPGRGTLMADALRAIRRALPQFMAAINVHLVETSPVLREKQADALRLSGIVPHWHERVGDVPPGPVIFIANEFFDALPIYQYQKTQSGWRERLVGAAGGQGFRMALSPVIAKNTSLPEKLCKAAIGDVAEISPARDKVVKTISKRLARQAGAALIIDYGHVKTAHGDTFQAVKNHQYTNPFHSPGNADLTSHVDFEHMGNIAFEGGAAVHGPITQGEFLTRLGIKARAQVLAGRGDGEVKIQIKNALKRLTDAGQMGELFKVLCLTSPTPVAPLPFNNQESL